MELVIGALGEFLVKGIPSSFKYFYAILNSCIPRPCSLIFNMRWVE
jgi:hypothetical protein